MRKQINLECGVDYGLCFVKKFMLWEDRKEKKRKNFFRLKDMKEI